MTIRDRITDFRRVPASDLIPNPRNWRTHPPEQAAAMRGILDEVGYADAVLARETPNGLMLVDGHLRREVAPDSLVPVLVLDVDEAEADLILATHDPLASMAGADPELLASLLDDISTDSHALESMLSDLSDESGIVPTPEIIEDEAPEPPVDPITKTGELWTLGDHRLLCGDSTKADDVDRLMDAKKADLWITDPPYNVALGMNETPAEAKKRNRRTDGKVVANDEMTDAEFKAFLLAAFTVAFDVMKPGAAFYIWHADSEGLNFRQAVLDSNQQYRQCLIWKKHVLCMGRQDYHWMHEPCLYGWKSGAAHGWYTDRKQTTVLQFDRPSRSTDHPTMKPVALFAYQIGNSTAPQGLVLDTFVGSGTSIVACEALGRSCRAMELAPQYCDVAALRWMILTGKSARCGKKKWTAETFTAAQEAKA